MKPTIEQLSILEEFKNHDILKINAVAGSGKSTTLRLLAEQNKVKSLYICFNKQNATLASESFPSYVDCKTVHSLAYAVFGKHLTHKLNTKDFKYINRGRTPKEIVNLYNIQDIRDDEYNYILPARVIASVAKSVVEVYQNSKDKGISEIHVTHSLKERLKLNTTPCSSLDNYVLTEVIKYSNLLWKDKTNPDSVVKCDHDTYQKLYQLSSPKLDYSIIYLDEAQDSSPVVLDILKQQTDIKIVYVGDTYQSIYAFRQAVNAMEMVSGKTMCLSQSFRYGEAIADVANFIIKSDSPIVKKPEINVKGLSTIESCILDRPCKDDEVFKKYTKLYRTNSVLLSDAVDLIGQGVKIKCEIDPTKFKSLILSSEALYKGEHNKIKDDEISLYASWQDMLDDADEDPEIKRLVGIVLSNNTWRYAYALDELIKDRKKPNSRYDILLTTAHKSKGMEWENVVIADDFNIDMIKPKDQTPPNKQEVNLFYVACTRAINNLVLPNDIYSMYLESKESK